LPNGSSDENVSKLSIGIAENKLIVLFVTKGVSCILAEVLSLIITLNTVAVCVATVGHHGGEQFSRSLDENRRGAVFLYKTQGGVLAKSVIFDIISRHMPEKTATKKKVVKKVPAKKAVVKKTAPKKEDSFAVILTGGKQYTVAVGDSVKIEKIIGDHKEGDKITFDKVLLVEDGKDTSIGDPYIKGASVGALIEEIGRSKKVDVVKYKSKSRYFKRNGHRQPFFQVKITEIK